MIEIVKGTLEERIIKKLQEKYPITLKELSNYLRISEKSAKTALFKLKMRGIIELEPLPGTIYIRLLRFDISFIGRRTQYKFIKRKTRSKDKENESKKQKDNDIMYT